MQYYEYACIAQCPPRYIALLTPPGCFVPDMVGTGTILYLEFVRGVPGVVRGGTANIYFIRTRIPGI